MNIDVPEQLKKIIKAGIEANAEIDGSVAVGGSICSLFTHHRESVDIDFFMTNLIQRFDEVRQDLLEIPEWKEARVAVPVLILGSLHGVEVGFRQLRRTVPLDTQIVETPDGNLIVPTINELLRIKAFLCYNRNYTRDFVDFAELSCLKDNKTVVDVLSDLDEKFGWEKQPSIVVEVIKKLLLPNPHDLEDEKHGFKKLRFLEPKLKTWPEVAAKCQEIGRLLSARILVDISDET